MKNLDIREAIEKAGLKHWQIAEAVGVSHYTFCVWLRTELSPERRSRIEHALEQLKMEGSYDKE